MTAIDFDPEIFDTDAAVEAIGDGLNAQGLDVRTFTADDSRLLKVDNVRSTAADLFIYPYGTVDWDYHSFTGTALDLRRVIAVTLAILAEPGSPAGATATRYPNASLLDNITRAAEEQGLSVTRASQEPGCAYLKSDDEVTIINPAQPQRGIVQITEDGALWWKCQLSKQPNSEDGLAVAEITASIARALTNSQTASPEPQYGAETSQSQKPAA